MKKKKKNKKLNKFCSIFDLKYWFYDFAKITGAIPTILYFRLKVIKMAKENKRFFKGPVIVVANHNTLMDPPIIANLFWYKRLSFLATSQLYRTKFLEWLFNNFKCIKVDRDDPSIKIIKDSIEVLNRGHSICIFPEGHVNVNASDGLMAFHSGASMIALQTNVPIKVLYLEKRNHWYNRVRVHIGKTINPNDFCSGPIPTIDDINRLTKCIEEELIKLDNEINNK